MSVDFLRKLVLEGKTENKQIYFRYYEVLWAKEDTVTTHEENKAK